MGSVREVLHSPLHESTCTQFFAAFLKNSATLKSPTHVLCALPDTILKCFLQSDQVTDVSDIAENILPDKSSVIH